MFGLTTVVNTAGLQSSGSRSAAAPRHDATRVACPGARWISAAGKSGGVRVIYYFHSDAMPLYLLTMFAKNERANLSHAERNELAGLVDVLVRAWFER